MKLGSDEILTPHDTTSLGFHNNTNVDDDDENDDDNDDDNNDDDDDDYDNLSRYMISTISDRD